MMMMMMIIIIIIIIIIKPSNKTQKVFSEIKITASRDSENLLTAGNSNFGKNILINIKEKLLFINKHFFHLMQEARLSHRKAPKKKADVENVSIIQEKCQCRSLQLFPVFTNSSKNNVPIYLYTICIIRTKRFPCTEALSLKSASSKRFL